MRVLYFKGLFSQLFTVRRISLAPVLCVKMSSKARQGKARKGYSVYKGISVYLGLKTEKEDTPLHPFTLPPPENTGIFMILVF